MESHSVSGRLNTAVQSVFIYLSALNVIGIWPFILSLLFHD